MWTRELTARQKTRTVLGVTVLLTAVVGIGLLLQEHGPGNMGTGFLQGAAVGLVLFGVVLWRASRPRRARRPSSGPSPAPATSATTCC